MALEIATMTAAGRAARYGSHRGDGVADGPVVCGERGRQGL